MQSHYHSWDELTLSLFMLCDFTRSLRCPLENDCNYFLYLFLYENMFCMQFSLIFFFTSFGSKSKLIQLQNCSKLKHYFMCELIFLLISLFKKFSFISSFSCKILLVFKRGGTKHFCNGHSLNSYLYFSQPLFVILVEQPLPHALENEKVILARTIQKQLTTFTIRVSKNKV